jgi:hypothetical protein
MNHNVRDEGVAGSNPATPTIITKSPTDLRRRQADGFGPPACSMVSDGDGGHAITRVAVDKIEE